MKMTAGDYDPSVTHGTFVTHGTLVGRAEESKPRDGAPVSNARCRQTCVGDAPRVECFVSACLAGHVATLSVFYPNVS